MKKWMLVLTAIGVLGASGSAYASYASTQEQAIEYYNKYQADYAADELVKVSQYRTAYDSLDNSTADRIVERGIWYMDNGYAVYGHGYQSYQTSGILDCSEFVSLVYGDFGYSLTDVAADYGSVGTKVAGVTAGTKVYPNGKTYAAIVGENQLKPGDILTFSKNKDGVITHVAIYLGIINGAPAMIGTQDQDTGKNPTALGIINDFRFTWGDTFWEARRVLPGTAYTKDVQVTGHEQGSPVIPASYVLPPQKTVVQPT